MTLEYSDSINIIIQPASMNMGLFNIQTAWRIKLTWTTAAMPHIDRKIGF